MGVALVSVMFFRWISRPSPVSCDPGLERCVVVLSPVAFWEFGVIGGVRAARFWGADDAEPPVALISTGRSGWRMDCTAPASRVSRAWRVTTSHSRLFGYNH